MVQGSTGRISGAVGEIQQVKYNRQRAASYEVPAGTQLLPLQVRPRFGLSLHLTAIEVSSCFFYVQDNIKRTPLVELPADMDHATKFLFIACGDPRFVVVF